MAGLISATRGTEPRRGRGSCPPLRANAAIFPPPDVVARVELIEEVGEVTVLYDRRWTEVKSR